MNTWRSEIDRCYPEWRRVAATVTRQDLADELLHDTLLKILESDKDKLQEIHDRGKLNNYVSNAIRLNAKCTNSSFNYKNRKFDRLRTEIKETCWIAHDDFKNIAMRLQSEQLDIFISRLPYFERELFFLYALDEFSYQKLSEETGIPINYLYRTIKKAKTTLRNSLKNDDK
jgi:RNA polymerase sigma factor (sigma-70 family)